MTFYQVETTEWKDGVLHVNTVLITVNYSEAEKKAIKSINDNNDVWIYEWNGEEKEIIKNYHK